MPMSPRPPAEQTADEDPRDRQGQDARTPLDPDRPVERLGDEGPGEEADDDHEEAELRAEVTDRGAQTTRHREPDRDLTRSKGRQRVTRRLAAHLAA
jgi:hypothetical protein